MWADKEKACALTATVKKNDQKQEFFAIAAIVTFCYVSCSKNS